MQMNELGLDSLDVVTLIKKGSVDFSNSNIDAENPCNTDVIESDNQPKSFILNVENCDSIATLTSVTYKSDK